MMIRSKSACPGVTQSSVFEYFEFDWMFGENIINVAALLLLRLKTVKSTIWTEVRAE
jgi:hypothetical protein